jgi:hypothetical protein
MAYDEYDSVGSGIYFTDDLIMIERYTLSEAKNRVAKKIYSALNIYFVEIDNYENGKDKKTKIELFSSPN